MTPGTEHRWARPRGLIRDALAMASSQYASRAALLVRGLAAAAVLGPHGYGGWNALNLIFDYGAYSPGGALHGLDLELPPAVAQGDGARQRRLMAGGGSAGGSRHGLRAGSRRWR